ncbi:MAG: hypothetical protein JWM04_845 [Verrucomicrobiales bacterium]|nr:hypothetical protein [Verrucomicrobiales bacterium]
MGQALVAKGKIKLKNFNPGYHDGLKKEVAKKETIRLAVNLGEMQNLLYANADHSVLILLQGMDTSGKDGAARHLLEFVNPAGVETASFKAPSTEERAHDFLWRIHKQVPRYGNIGVFNRSHYEEVLISRVLKLVPVETWKKRYDQINDFEKMLIENRVVLLKFFLHISKAEQRERLESRLKDRTKNWKFSVEDLKMRSHWNEFQEAYEDMLNKCNTSSAPWHIVPADNKWYRDLVIAQTVVAAMDKLKLKWPRSTEDLSKIKVK